MQRRRLSASLRSLRDLCRTPRPCIPFCSNIAGDVAFVKNSATSEGADRKASNESLVEGFSDEKEIQSTPTPSRGHANMVEARCHQRVRSGWFGGFLRWRARTSCHTEFDCDRNACANSHPVFNCPAAHHSAAVRWVGFSKKCQSGRRARRGELGPMPKGSPKA